MPGRHWRALAQRIVVPPSDCARRCGYLVKRCPIDLRTTAAASARRGGVASASLRWFLSSADLSGVSGGPCSSRRQPRLGFGSPDVRPGEVSGESASALVGRHCRTLGPAGGSHARTVSRALSRFAVDRLATSAVAPRHLRPSPSLAPIRRASLRFSPPEPPAPQDQRAGSEPCLRRSRRAKTRLG